MKQRQRLARRLFCMPCLFILIFVLFLPAHGESPQADNNRTLFVLCDISGSMPVSDVNGVARALIDTLTAKPPEGYNILWYTFGDSCNQVHSSQELVAATSNTSPHTDYLLAFQTIQKLAQAEDDILLITDGKIFDGDLPGEPDRSEYTQSVNQIVTSLAEDNIRIHPVIINRHDILTHIEFTGALHLTGNDKARGVKRYKDWEKKNLARTEKSNPIPIHGRAIKPVILPAYTDKTVADMVDEVTRSTPFGDSWYEFLLGLSIKNYIHKLENGDKTNGRSKAAEIMNQKGVQIIREQKRKAFEQTLDENILRGTISFESREPLMNLLKFMEDPYKKVTPVVQPEYMPEYLQVMNAATKMRMKLTQAALKNQKLELDLMKVQIDSSLDKLSTKKESPPTPYKNDYHTPTGGSDKPSRLRKTSDPGSKQLTSYDQALAVAVSIIGRQITEQFIHGYSDDLKTIMTYKLITIQGIGISIDTLFPATSDTLQSQGISLRNLGTVYRPVLYEDVNNLPETMLQLLLLKDLTDPTITTLLSLVEVLRVIEEGQNPVDALHTITIMSQDSTWGPAARRAWYCLDALRDSNGTISAEELLVHLDDEKYRDVLGGLIYQRIVNDSLASIGFPKSATGRLDDTQKENLRNLMIEAAYQGGLMYKTLGTLQQIQSNPGFSADDYRDVYATYLTHTLKAILTTTHLDRKKTQFRAADPFIAFYAASQRQDFKAMFRHFNALTIALGRTSELNEEQSEKVWEAFDFVVDLLSAETEEELAQAIESRLMPVGSYRLKREQWCSLTVGVYPGALAGWNMSKEFRVVNAGLTAPLGISLSMPCDQCLDTIFLGLLDIAAPLTVYFAGGQHEKANTTLSQVLAPSLILYEDIDSTFYSVGLGVQYLPRSFNQQIEKGVTETKSTYRVMVTFSMDVPLLALRMSEKSLKRVQAEEYADDIVWQAEELAEQIRKQARKNAEELRKKAKKDAKKIRKHARKDPKVNPNQADKDASKLEDQENKKADLLIEKAEKKAEDLINEARIRAEQKRLTAKSL